VFNDQLVSVYGATLGLIRPESDGQWALTLNVWADQPFALCSNGTRFTSVTVDGAVLISTDGLVWSSTGATLDVTGTNDGDQSIAAHDDVVVTVPSVAGGVVQTSVNAGISFTEYSVIGFDVELSACHWDGQYFILWVQDLDTGDSHMFRSSNGVTWTETGNRPAWQTNICSFASGAGVTVCTNAGNGACYSTNNGLTWIDSDLQPSEDPWDVSYGNGIFVVVADPGAGQGDTYTSTDGITWTTQSQVLTYSASSGQLVFTGSQFIYTRSSEVYFTSVDGAVWVRIFDGSGATWGRTVTANGITVSSNLPPLSCARLGGEAITTISTVTSGSYDFAQSPL